MNRYFCWDNLPESGHLKDGRLCEDIIKMGFTEACCEGMNLAELVLDRVQ
jgi:hypothetical protein